mmetsp:Transcript_70877/g.169133  ORF Transcript_70877/g.169133 Transcript_70877/m.169133 type:complete len:486 (+) Transcript_70877:166-1623(+)|eukprot:CAMPEP_0181462938 /NCGR_PEP_ID=MMETSP1110-20121109/34656_1 /TAXON_ID=174948 /ORGANISM="Symbiodinium sp., Strain CCMP421" /LENGTH=485 /DNA_ID=CAMNT_0023587619 /DNA_START=148 /DNA_END=1605 /DNA_ORIENTATION=-
MSMSLKASSSPLAAVIQPSNNLLILLVLTAICIVVPLDLTQLIFACLGAFCYYVVQLLQRSVSVPASSSSKKLKVASATDSDSSSERPVREVRKPKRIPTTRKPGTHVDTQAQTPAVPIVAPQFQGQSLQEEVQELVSQIMPTAASQRGVDRLAEAIRVMLANSLPEVEVVGFASSDLSRGRANGVAVPDVDIVINVRPDRVSPKVASRPAKVSSDPRMLQKWALRHCADRLVSAGGFKFRRSGFRGNEPKMTLLVPTELGIFNQAVPIDIAVNAVAPLHSAALLTECGNINPRSKELILIIRRWAKDRGVCHAPKGHLSPYVWSLLVVYYLQVAERSEGALLPPMEEFEAIANLLPDRSNKKSLWQTKEQMLNVPLAHLLSGFMQFYNNFPWKQQAVSVLRGTPGPAPLSLPINLIEHDDGKTVECGPNIEDPFAPKTNLGSSMTWWSFQRLREELARAASLLSDDTASMSKLLEPWAPETPEA